MSKQVEKIDVTKVDRVMVNGAWVYMVDLKFYFTDRESKSLKVDLDTWGKILNKSVHTKGTMQFLKTSIYYSVLLANENNQREVYS